MGRRDVVFELFPALGRKTDDGPTAIESALASDSSPELTMLDDSDDGRLRSDQDLGAACVQRTLRRVDTPGTDVACELCLFRAFSGTSARLHHLREDHAAWWLTAAVVRSSCTWSMLLSIEGTWHNLRATLCWLLLPRSNGP